jgi:hypothetical protein
MLFISASPNFFTTIFSTFSFYSENGPTNSLCLLCNPLPEVLIQAFKTAGIICVEIAVAAIFFGTGWLYDFVWLFVTRGFYIYLRWAAIKSGTLCLAFLPFCVCKERFLFAKGPQI